MRRWVSLLSLLFLFLSPFSASASRIGIVEPDEAPLLESPSSNSKVLEVMRKGMVVLASNYPTEGFHKVKTEGGTIGWMPSDSLNLKPIPPPEENMKEEIPGTVPKSEPGAAPVKYNHVRVSGQGGMDFFYSPGVITNFDNISLGYHIGGEIVVALSEYFGIGLRGEQMLKSLSVADSGTGKNYLVNIDAIPIMAGVSLTAVEAERIAIYFSLFGGMALKTSITSQSIADGDTEGVAASVLTGMAKVEIHGRFTSTISVFLEGGYRFLQAPLIQPNPAGNGGAILLPTFTLNLSGLFTSAGIALSF